MAFGHARAESFANMSAEEVASWLIANGTGWSIDAHHQQTLVNTTAIIAGTSVSCCLLCLLVCRLKSHSCAVQL